MIADKSIQTTKYPIANNELSNLNSQIIHKGNELMITKSKINRSFLPQLNAGILKGHIPPVLVWYANILRCLISSAGVKNVTINQVIVTATVST